VSTSAANYHHGNLRDALLSAGLAALEGPDGQAPSLREQAEAAKRAGGGAEGFAETGRTYVRFALAHPALFRLMFTQGSPVDDTGTPDEARALLTANTQALASDPERAETLALQAWSIAHGIAMLMLDGRIPADDALIDRMLATDSLFP